MPNIITDFQNSFVEWLSEFLTLAYWYPYSGMSMYIYHHEWKKKTAQLTVKIVSFKLNFRFAFVPFYLLPAFLFFFLDPPLRGDLGTAIGGVKRRVTDVFSLCLLSMDHHLRMALGKHEVAGTQRLHHMQSIMPLPALSFLSNSLEPTA